MENLGLANLHSMVSILNPLPPPFSLSHSTTNKAIHTVSAEGPKHAGVFSPMRRSLSQVGKRKLAVKTATGMSYSHFLDLSSLRSRS